MDGVELKKTNIKAFAYNAQEPVKFQGKFEVYRDSKACRRCNLLCGDYLYDDYLRQTVEI